MTNSTYIQIMLVVATPVTLAILMIYWTKHFGWKKAALLVLARGVVMACLLSIFFPKTEHYEESDLPQDHSRQELKVFIDNSQSVSESRLAAITSQVAEIGDKYNLQVKTELLSELDSDVLQGYSPLHNNLIPWIKKSLGQNWLIVSDGADEEPWNSQESISGLSNLYESRLQSTQNHFQGIVHLESISNLDLSLESTDTSPLLFQDKPSVLEVMASRKDRSLEVALKSQVQVFLGDKFLTSSPVQWQSGETQTNLQLTLPPIKKGLASVKIVLSPDPTETVLWNNEKIIPMEVLTNTVGVLHLLGRPSWDGRFFRRFIKTEPKFDIVSFFILRDLFDDQPVPEAELSLIPFPVDQLFTDELASFKMIAMQDFSLTQYLKPEYQQNLISYVKSGGSLLMIGGEKALAQTEFSSQEMSSLLPFDPSPPLDVKLDDSREYFLRIPSKTTSSSKQSKLASDLRAFFEKYPVLQKFPIRKLHRINPSKFIKNSAEILIEAVDQQTKETFPFLVSSLPQNGRAIWIFTDQLWTLTGFEPNKTTRRLYAEWMNIATRWLLKDQWSNDIQYSGMLLRKNADSGLLLTFMIKDEQKRFLEDSGLTSKISVSICGKKVDSKSVNTGIYESQWLQVEAHADLRTVNDKTKYCPVEITIGDKSQGVEDYKAILPILERVADVQLSPEKSILSRLATATRAEMISLNDQNKTSSGSNLYSWLDLNLARKIKKYPSTSPQKKPESVSRTQPNPYWAFSNVAIVFLMAIAMLIEVYIRRLAGRWDEGRV